MRFIACLFVLMTLTPPAALATEAAVGLVHRIEPWAGASSKVLLDRKGEKERSLILGEYVFDGDRIRVPDANATVTLAVPGGTLAICPRGSRSEQCVAMVDGRSGFLKSVVTFGRSLNALLSWYGTTTTVNLTTRDGSPPQFKIGAGAGQKIHQGPGTFWLAWNGGKAPYDLRVVQEGKILASLRTIGQNETIIHDVFISAGRVEFEVVDSLGRKGVLKAEVSGGLPNPPDFGGAAPSKAYEAYFAAAWLAAQGDGAFALESTARLTPIVTDIPAALALRKALSVGERPRL